MASDIAASPRASMDELLRALPNCSEADLVELLDAVWLEYRLRQKQARVDTR